MSHAVRPGVGVQHVAVLAIERGAHLHLAARRRFHLDEPREQLRPEQVSDPIAQGPSRGKLKDEMVVPD